MPWPLLIIAGASAAAGFGMGRVVSPRLRGFMLIGGGEAVVLALALRWLAGQPEPLLPAEFAGVMALLLFGVAAVVLPFAIGAWWAHP
jgi:hypothetical protein